MDKLPRVEEVLQLRSNLDVLCNSGDARQLRHSYVLWYSTAPSLHNTVQHFSDMSHDQAQIIVRIVGEPVKTLHEVPFLDRVRV